MKVMMSANYKPTPCHYFMRLLEEKNQLLRIYSQNIDTLEKITGISESLIVNAHGSYNKGHCIICNKEYSFEWMISILFKIIVRNSVINVCLFLKRR